MSRVYENDDLDYGQYALWENATNRAINGRRGQRLLREMLTALDAMTVKRLIADGFCRDGDVCAFGALEAHRIADEHPRTRALELLSAASPEYEDGEDDGYTMSKALEMGWQKTLAWTIIWENDHAMRIEQPSSEHRYGMTRIMTPEERWQYIRDWVAERIIGDE